jgi:hypothetical protein
VGKVAAGICAALALATTGSAGAGSGVRFSRLPARVVAGSTATVVVSAPGTGRCLLSVRYADGTGQGGIATAPLIGGRATWRWKVDDTTAAGRAVVTATCGKARIRGRMLIVGSLIAPKIVVVKDGFSTRSRFNGTVLSYGLVLRNTSPNADALNIYALVNFVLADNRALGTVTQNVGAIGAGSTFYLGGSMTFPGLAPVARLEVVLRVRGHQRKRLFTPSVANSVVEGSPSDPGWVGDVAGELVNDDPPWIMQRAQMWAVVFDSAGNVIGGGQGFASAELPPGTREVFKLTQGFNAIPLDKAASAGVSSVPTYTGP